MLKRIVCSFKGHDYYLEEDIDVKNKKIGCARCGQLWLLNEDINELIDWDEDFDEMFEEVHQQEKESKSDYFKMLNGDWYKENKDK